MKWSRCLILLLVGAMLVPESASARYFTFTDLGPKVVPADINNYGQILIYDEREGVDTRTYVMDTDLTITPISMPDSTYSQAFRITDSGQVLIRCEGRYCGITGYVWQDGTLTQIGYYSPPTDINEHGEVVLESGHTWRNGVLTAPPVGGRMFAINDSGAIAGESVAETGYYTAAIIVGERVSNIGTLGGNISGILDINNDSVAVGYALTSDDRRHPFVYDGSMAGLGVFFGGDRGEALSVNSKGEVVGYANEAPARSHGFLWLPEDAYGLRAGGLHKLIDIAPFPYGTEHSFARAINDGGLIVGYYTLVGKPIPLRGFLLTPSGYVPPPDAPPLLSGGSYPGSGEDADPVNTFTGEFVMREAPDLYLDGPMPLSFSRYYASNLGSSWASGTMGVDWRHTFDWSLSLSRGQVRILNSEGGLVTCTFGGTWTCGGNAGYQLLEDETRFRFLDPAANRIYSFAKGSGRLMTIEDGHGNSQSLTYNDTGQLATVTDGLDRTLSVTWLSGRIRSVTDGARTVTFFYIDNKISYYYDVLNRDCYYDYENTGFDKLGKLTYKSFPDSSYFLVEYSESGRVSRTYDGWDRETAFAYAPVTLTTSVTDALGNTRRQTHDAEGRLVKSTDEAGNATTFGYGADSPRSSVTDPLGHTTSWTYHPQSNKLEAVLFPDGTSVTNAYTMRTLDGFNHFDLTRTTFTDGSQIRFTYDASGNILSFVDRGGFTSQYTYNDRGQVLSSTNPQGATVTYAYNANGTLGSITDPAANVTAFAYDGFSRNTGVSHPDGTQKLFAYDDLCRVTRITDEGGNLTRMTYNGFGNLATVTDESGGITTFSYSDDGYGRLLQIKGPLGEISTVTYDGAGRIDTQTNANGAVTNFQYDAVGNLITMTDARGYAWNRSYDAKRRLTGFSDPLGNTASVTYDAMGRVASLTDPAGNRRSYTYSPMGQVVATRDPLGRTTSYVYDGRGYLSGITSANGSQVLVDRNALGQATKITGPNGSVWQLEFNAQGQLTANTDPLGNRWTRTYDNRNKLSQVVLPGDAGTVSFTYDPKGNLVARLCSDGTQLNFTYDAKNRLISAGNVTMERDANGNITRSNGLGVKRDPGGRISAVAFAPGQSVAYGYDANGNLIQVTDWLGNTTTMTYDAASRLLTLARPNGIVTAYAYDANSRIKAIAEAKEGTLSSIVLERDAAGDVVSAQRNVPLPARVSQGSQAWQFNASGQIAGFHYDPMGRLRADADRTFSWDLVSRLIGLHAGGQTTTFVYDDLGHVISRSSETGSESYVWNYAFALPAISVARIDGADSRYYIHTPAGDLLYFIDNRDGQAHFYHYDEMGSTLFLTDAGGSITDAYAYTPYGEAAGSTGQTRNPFTFIGRYGVTQEGLTGLYQMHRRFYDSRTHRFISPEPAMDFNRLEGLNPYLYAAGNPLRYIDPTGEANEDKAGQAPIPMSVEIVKAVHDKEMMIVAKVLEDAVDRSADVAEVAQRMNTLNRTFGKESPAWMRTVLDQAEALKSAKNVLDMAGDVSQGFGLALDTYERGPEAIVEYGATQAGEKIVGKKVMFVYNIYNERQATLERVHEVVNDEKGLNDANLSSLYKLMDAANRAYFKEKIIDKDQYVRLMTDIQQGFDMSVAAATESGYLGVAIESLKGLRSMLESFIGM